MRISTMAHAALMTAGVFATAAAAERAGSLSPVLVADRPVTMTVAGRTLLLTPGRTTEHPSVNAVSVRGLISGEGEGSFIFAQGPTGIEGALWVGERVYTLRAPLDQSAPLRIEEYELEHQSSCAGGLIPHDTPRMSVVGERAHESSLGTRSAGGARYTRVLIVYDDLAESEVGDMGAFAAALMESANTSYANSGVSGTRLELAGIHRVENPSDRSSGVVLRRLTNPHDHEYDSLHAVRDALDADVVAHLTELSDACGRGWLSPGNGNLAFSTTDVDCALGNLSFAHEVGHNQGCTHDPENAGGAYISFGYGHRWDDDRYRSVMAYAPGSRIMHFSNPGVLHNGYPTGIANQRDNARVLDLTAGMMAGMRQGDGGGIDCDGNGVVDEYEIALNGSLDLDRDGMLDACQIFDDPSLDCDGNGTLDHYQVAPWVRQSLGVADAFGGGVWADFDAPVMPMPSDDVTVIVDAYGDLGNANEYLTLDFNDGSLVVDVFDGTGYDCPNAGATTSFTIGRQQAEGLIAEGVSVRATPSDAVGQGSCLYTHLEVTFEYHTADTSYDSDGDGVIDSCTCAPDRNNDGELNFFDVTDFIAAYQSMSPSADLDGNGEFNFFDVTRFIAAFQAGCP